MFKNLCQLITSRLKVNAAACLILIVGGGMFAGCNVTDTSNEEPDAVFEYDFRESEFGWESFFTNYNVGNSEGMDFETDYRSLPEPLNTADMAQYIRATNQSDDVKMLFRREVNGLAPNTEYGVQFDIRFGTSVPSGCFGIGGSPGGAVRVIADASRLMPEPFIEDGYYLLNVEQEGDPEEWYQNAIMGDIANSRECEDGYEYEIKEIQSGPGHAAVTTDENGSAWLLFGTRSGFEGTTELYYTYIKAEFYEM